MKRRFFWKEFGPLSIVWDNTGSRTLETLIGIERCYEPNFVGYWLTFRCLRFGVHFKLKAQR